MSWNANRFGRVLPAPKPGERHLNLWMTADALDRITASGGYFESLDDALSVARDALGRYDVISVGVPGSPLWDADARLLGNGDYHPGRDFDSVIIQARAPHLMDAEIKAVHDRALRNGDVAYADYVRRHHRTLWLGGHMYNREGDLLAYWNISRGTPVSGTPLETVAAAYLMATDPESRDLAACTHEARSVKLKSKERARPGQPSRRRESDVHVIDIRQPSESERAAIGGVGQGTREYTHRWVVRGHWRNQAYGPKRSLRRRKWISEHIAGPDHLPVRSGTTVHRIA